MFEFVFPIFCFGLVVTGIVVKGLLLAAEENQLQAEPKFGAENRKILRAFKLTPEASQQSDGSACASMRSGSL